MGKFCQDVKFSTQIASHQVELGKEENITDENILSNSYLQTDYLNLDRSSSCGKNSERANLVQKKCTFCRGVNHSAEKFKRIRKEKEKYRTAVDSDNRKTERTPRKCFRCGSEDHLIDKCPRPSKENYKRQKQVRFSEMVDHALQK